MIIWLHIIQGWGGLAGVTVYAPTLFMLAGYYSLKSQWMSGLNTLIPCSTP